MPAILLMHPFDAIAGSQRIAIDLARALQSGGCPVEVRLGFGSQGFVSQWPGVRRFLDINHIPTRKLLYPLWLFAMLPRVLLAVLAGEVVWANTIHAAPAACLALVLAPKRVVIHVHEVEFPVIFRALLRWATYRGATLLCVSDYHRRALGLDAQVLPNSVTLNADPPMQTPRSQLVFVGNTSALKGFALFIEVARQLEKAAGLTPVAFLPPAQLCEPALLREAQAAHVDLRHGVTDPRDMFGAAYLLLLCTDPARATETFSLVAVEAMSALVPVASAGTGVLKEVLGDALAFDVPSRDPVRMAAEVVALRSSPDRYQALVEACRARRGDYTFDRFRARVLALVARAASGGRG